MPPLPNSPRRPGRLRLKTVRSRHSLALDQDRTPVIKASGRGGERLPPFVPWPQFYADFARRFSPGDHVTGVGATKSGKTTLLREVAYLRNFVAVAATKRRDSSLYEPLKDHGFEIVERFLVDEWAELPRQIVRPELAGVDRAAIADQAAVFSDMIYEIWNNGRWSLFADEIRYLTKNLKLGIPMETLWLQGRSLEASVICGTQRPVGIPLEAFSQCMHLFIARTTDEKDLERCAEFVAGDKAVVKYTAARLPKWEFLYVERETGLMVRTKVVL